MLVAINGLANFNIYCYCTVQSPLGDEVVTVFGTFIASHFSIIGEHSQ